MSIPSLEQGPSLRLRRAAALSIVAGIHAMLGFALWQLKLTEPQRRSERAQSLTIQLLPVQAERRRETLRMRLTRKTERPQPLQALQPLQPLQPLQRPAVSEAPSLLLAPVPGLPAVQGSQPSQPGNGKIGLDGRAVAVPGAAASGASGASGLNLAPSREVLRGALANPAISDPRSNSPRPTVEERMAMALDPELCLLAERLPDGTVRRRMSRWRRVQSTMSAVHAQGQGQARICE